jgi:trimeric autotransporter adhesin
MRIPVIRVRSRRRVRAVTVALACAGGLLGGLAWAFEPKDDGSELEARAFFKPELYISSSHSRLEQIQTQLPNRAAWESFQAARQNAGQAPVRAYIDPRSGAASNLLAAFPLIPGRGTGNNLKLADLSARLGRPLGKVDAAAVSDAVLAFARQNRGVLAIDTAQLGASRADQVRPDLWQVSVPQTYRGIPVRYGRLAATINNGNLVLLGTEAWGDVRGLSTVPKYSGEDALKLGFEHIGASALDDVVRRPLLEILPVAPPEHQRGEAFAGPIGAGYRHRLVWTYHFRRAPDHATWEVIVDAHSGEVLALQDVNQYIEHQVTGGVYPVTSTEGCPTNGTCGTMQSGWPMPFADTGLAAPNNFTNSAGLFDWTSGATATTLTGRYVDIVDNCGAVNNTSATGSILLGGTNGQHDCTGGGGGAGNTAASRTAFYEVNKLAEQARGWLPTNTWLQARLTTNVNLNQTCNAFWDFSTINFYRSGGGCRNTGEIAGVFDHEWGHGLDDNDAAGVLSNSSEGYADIAAIYRLQDSCLGHGFFWTSNKGCGQTADGTGFNQNEAQQGAAHCDTNCSGVRDADWARHSDNTPDTALGFVCTSCLTGSGPCGRQVHCAAAPSRQAAWDFATRDLTAAPFNLDSQTAFIVANKVFYQGSGNIGSWHACTCGSTSSGCGATNGYMQWLAADDDNGNVNDGTPHMTALFNAFNRHGIACSTPTPVNSGCAGGPATAPTLAVTPGSSSASLSWNTVAGATRYWVFRSEGHAGCNFGKTLIAEVTGTTYTDTQVANGRLYSYNVAAAGSSSACFSRASNCVQVTPVAGPPTPDFTVSCSPSTLSVTQGSSTASTCTVTSTGGFAGAVNLACTGLPAGVTCAFATNPVTPPANGTVNSALTIAASGTATTGAASVQAQGTSGALTRSAGLALTVNPTGGGGGGPQNAAFDATLQTPKCATVGSSCDSGATLLNGRDSLATGPEPNQPNTINDSCADGSSGSFHVDESNDRLKVTTLDGTDFAPGKTVRIDATAWVWSTPSSDHLDLYYAADANSPAWTYITTVNPTASGAQTLSATYTLPSGPLQAIRARFRYQGSAAACGSGAYDDHDDLVFAVASPSGGAQTATFDATLQAPKCGTVGISCDSGASLLNGRGTMSGGVETNQPNTINDSCADGASGSYHSDESNDRIKVSTVDGTAFAPGKTVRIDATAWVWSTPSSDHLDLYYAANAASPVWTFITTINPTLTGSQTLSATYTLPSGTLQAVRARFRYQGSATACAAGAYIDHDDLIFAVNP